MQPGPRFYGRYFAETHLYLYQYQVERPWQGLLILQSRQQNLGSEAPYVVLLERQVQQLYLQDLRNESQLPLSLALLQLIVLSDESVPQAAKELLEAAKRKGTQTFQRTLEIVEAILISKFPKLSPQEVLVMLDIKTADFRQTRFYQDVFQEGREEGEAKMLLKFLNHRFGDLPEDQVAQIKALPLAQLDELGEVIFDLADLAALDEWLLVHPVAVDEAVDETE
jgi:predicted transposase YdaD